MIEVWNKKFSCIEELTDYLKEHPKIILKPLVKINKEEAPHFIKEMEEFWKNKSRKVTVASIREPRVNKGEIYLSLVEERLYSYNINWFDPLIPKESIE